MKPNEVVASETESYLMIMGTGITSLVISDSELVLARVKVTERRDVRTGQGVDIHLKVKLEGYMQAADTIYKWKELETANWFEMKYPSSIINEDTGHILPMSENNLTIARDKLIENIQADHNEKVTTIRGITYEEVTNTN